MSVSECTKARIQRKNSRGNGKGNIEMEEMKRRKRMQEEGETG